jgi:cysteine desulfurase / selenocysteine lyase
MTLYLDNAATTWPKPPSVYDAVKHALEFIGASPGRAAHRMAREASQVVESARQRVARLLGIESPDRVVFTKNTTESINIVLKGWLRPGDRVLMSSMEHNSVARPLMAMEAKGLQVEAVPCGPSGELDLGWMKRHMNPPPRLVVFLHASNVNGVLFPIVEASQICNDRGVPLLLDAAQTAGLQPIDAQSLNLGMLACSGHKALLGPPGVGILYIRPDLDVLPLMEGGTGSHSEDLTHPDACPDRFESGTGNLPGIAGLAAGIEFIQQQGRETILAHELHLAAQLETGLSGLPGVQVLQPAVRGTGVVSFTVENLNPSDVGFVLDQGFDIAVRAGLHCAPLAHRALGTFPEGTVRVSPGFSTTEADIAFLLEALSSIVTR